MRIFSTGDKLISGVSVLFLLLLWKAAAAAAASDLIIPPPEKVFGSLVAMVMSDAFFPSVGHTVFRGLMGFALSIALGITIGMVAGLSKIVNTLITPLLVAVRSTPVISVILLALIWFDSDFVPVFIGLLMMFPIVCVNVIEGIKSVDRELVEMAKSYRVDVWRIITEVYVPAIAPFLIGGISNAVGIGWKAIIASEVLSQPRFAIGTRMHAAQSYLLTVEVIAWTMVAVVISYLFENLVRAIEKRVIVWR